MSYIDEIKENIPIKRKQYTPRVLEELDKTLMFYEHYFLINLAKCESPIEQLFAIHFLDAYLQKENEYMKLDPTFEFVDYAFQTNFKVKDKNIRVDFFISCKVLGKLYKFAIECDGHDFHEKTKQQVIRDKARDRALQSIGITVIRFSGSEIWKNPSRCVHETFEIISEQTGLEDLLRQEINQLFGLPDDDD